MKKFYENALTFQSEPGRDGIGDIHQPVYLAREVDAELDTLRAQLAEAKSVLRELEWVGVDNRGEGAWCELCGNPKELGHKPNCRLSKLINASESDDNGGLVGEREQGVD